MQACLVLIRRCEGGPFHQLPLVGQQDLLVVAKAEPGAAELG